MVGASWAAMPSDGYELLLRNQTVQAITTFRKDTAAVDSMVRARALRGLGLAYETAGNDDAAARSYLDAYLANGDADHLMVNANSLLGVLRTADSLLQPRLQAVMARLDRENPAHPVRSELYEEMGHFVMETESPAHSWDYHEKTAPVRRWKIAGPFDNVSNSGILRKLAVEKGFNLKEKYSGLAGLPVTWNDFEVKAHNGWAMMNERQGMANALNYFATTLVSPVEQPVIISFGVSGVFSLWVNGKRLAHSEVFQNTGREGYRLRTLLKQGQNSVLLKLGHESGRSSNFLLRVGDLQGRPLTLQTQPVAQGPVSNDSSGVEVLTPALVARFAKQAGAPYNDPEALVQLARHHISREEFLPAKLALRELSSRYPGSAFVAALTGNIYSREDNITLAELQYERAHRFDSTNSSGWAFTYTRLISHESWQDAYSLFMSKPQGMQASADQLVNHIVTCYKLSRQQDMLAWLDTLLSHPDPYSQLAGAEIVGNLGNSAMALQIIQGVEARAHAQQNIASRLATRLRAGGKNEQAVAILEKALTYFPESIDLLYNMADIRFQDKDYAKAELIARRGLQINPMHVAFQKMLGKCRELQGDKKGAIAAYQEVLRLGRSDFELSDHLLEMQKQKTLRESVSPWDIFHLIREGREWKVGRTENSVILLSQRSLMAHAWGGFEVQDRMVVEVLDPQGVDDWKEYELGYESNYERLQILRAVSIKPDGKTLQADIDGTQMVFSGLAPGDLIEVLVSRQSSFIGQIAGHFWSKHPFRYTVPLMHSQFEVLTPQGRSYQVKQYNTPVQGKMSTRNGLSVRTFEVAKVLSAPAESNMPPWSDALSWVQVSSVPNWGFIADWYHGLTEGKSVATPELRAFADSLFAGTTDTAEKIRRVHNFITSDVRYSYMSFRQSGYVPQSASKTLATRIGDCKDMATLARSLLLLGGVNSDLVLVNTNDDGRSGVLPMIEFNHCILREPGGRYVDFTASHNGWKSLPRSDQGARALVAASGLGDSLRWLPWLPTPEEYTVRESFDTLRADGSFARRIVTRRGGNFAALARGWYRFQNDERNDLEILRSIQKLYPGAELTYNKLEGLDSLDREVVHDYAFRSRLAGWTTEATLSMPIPWSDDVDPASLPGELTRQYHFEYWRNWTFFGSYEHKMHLALPKGWRLLDLPKAQKIAGNFGTYATSYHIEKGVLEATRTFSAKVLDVKPAQYPAFRAELESLLKADRSMLVLVRE